MLFHYIFTDITEHYIGKNISKTRGESTQLILFTYIIKTPLQNYKKNIVQISEENSNWHPGCKINKIFK